MGLFVEMFPVSGGPPISNDVVNQVNKVQSLTVRPAFLNTPTSHILQSALPNMPASRPPFYLSRIPYPPFPPHSSITAFPIQPILPH